MRLRELGNRTIPRPIGMALFYKDGDTKDIATKVMKVYSEQRHQVTDYARYMKGPTLYDTCRNIWQVVKENIRYQVDPKGNQWVRRPAQMWWSGVGDCKSYSVFIASCLDALGIAGCFRFASYDKNNPLPTHVYVVVKNNNQEIILDAVMPGFNQEKPYANKLDYSMTRIYELAGFGTTGVRTYTKAHISGGLSTALNKGGRRRVLADSLPGLAMLALYQFIPAGSGGDFIKDIPAMRTPDNLLDQVPEVVRRKRLTSFQSFWDFGDWADLKVENDVFPQVKQLLTQQLGMDPFQWWRNVLRACAGQTSTSRIGAIDPVTLMAAASKAGAMFTKIKSVVGNLFGGTDIRWKRGDPSTWAPSNDDWSSWACKPLAYISTGSDSPNTGSGMLNWGDIINTSNQPPANTNQPPPGNPYNPPPANTNQPPPAQQDSNTGLIIAAAAVAVVLLMKK